MTGIIVTCQPKHNRIVVLTDGAHYTPDGLVVGVSTKGFPVSSWPGFAVGRGPSIGALNLAAALAIKLPTFDDVIEHAEELMPSLVAELDLSGFDGDTTTIELVMTGFSKRRGAPEAYVVRTTDALPPGMTRADLDAFIAAESLAGRETFFPKAFKMIRLDDVVCAPIVDKELRRQSGYCGVDKDDPLDQVTTDMLMAIECQRQQLDPGNGRSIVGALACLTIITPDGIEQRIVKRWESDVIGQYIEPRPIDWKAWRASRSVAVAGIPDGLSRMQRERMEKKARKGTLRSV